MEFGIAYNNFDDEWFDLNSKIERDLMRLMDKQWSIIERSGQSYMLECRDIAINIYDCDVDCVMFWTDDLYKRFDPSQLGYCDCTYPI